MFWPLDKVTFLIQKNSIQVGGGSYLLWAIENFQEFSDSAAKIAESEVIVLDIITFKQTKTPI